MHPAFIDGSGGRLFTLYFAPDAGPPARGALLFIPPFAEELNRSRHMVVKTARALAASGWGVLLLDLFGTGDSEGEYAEARWPIWVDDVRRGIAHLQVLGHATIGLWAMRTGCLLAAEILAAERLADEVLAQTACTPLIFWQPVLKGRTFLNQFIRIGLAASLTGADASGQDLRQRLAGGQPIEIAGYTLHPALAASLEGAALATNMAWPGPLTCLEVSSGTLSPPLARAVESWRSHGAGVTAQAIAGPQFWMLQEPEWVEDLITATVKAGETA